MANTVSDERWQLLPAGGGAPPWQPASIKRRNENLREIFAPVRLHRSGTFSNPQQEASWLGFRNSSMCRESGAEAGGLRRHLQLLVLCL